MLVISNKQVEAEGEKMDQGSASGSSHVTSPAVCCYISKSMSTYSPLIEIFPQYFVSQGCET